MLCVKVHKLCNGTIRQTQTTPSIYIHSLEILADKKQIENIFSFVFSFCADVGSGNEVTSLLN